MFEHAARDEEVRGLATTRADVERLWDVCQIPDYRKISPAAHAELVATLYGFLARHGKFPPTGLPNRSRWQIIPTATSIRSPRVLRIFGRGLSRPIGRIGSTIPSIGRMSRARSRIGFLMRCTSDWRSGLSIVAPAY